MKQKKQNSNLLRKLLDQLIFLKRLIVFIIVIVIGVLIYQFLINYVLSERSVSLGLVSLWFFTAYLVLPRLHRILTKIYLPNYFIGRARTGDGLLGDPVNLAYTGTKRNLENAMQNAGWIEADPLSYHTIYKMIKASILGRSYPEAPVSSLYLFGNKQDLAFQQEVEGSTKKRHHVRFWKCPAGWYLPGGYKVDYLGAATYDRAVGFSLYTFQITHKIEEDIDTERDYVVETIKSNNKNTDIKYVKNFTTGYHTRNSGGDTIRTDGSLPFIKIT